MITLRTRECIYREVKVGMIALANPSRDEIGLAAKYKAKKWTMMNRMHMIKTANINLVDPVNPVCPCLNLRKQQEETCCCNQPVTVRSISQSERITITYVRVEISTK